MAQTKGTVARTTAKDWAGKKGNVVLYSFQLAGDQSWYRCGTTRPNFAEGDSITFDYTDDGRNRTLVENSVVKSAPTQAQVAPAVRAPAAKENWDARAAYWDSKEKREIEVVEPRITLSASRTAAIAVIGLALQHDAIVFGNANKGARLGIILDAVDEVTKRYYDQSMGKSAEDEPTYDDDAPAEAGLKE